MVSQTAHADKTPKTDKTEYRLASRGRPCKSKTADNTAHYLKSAVKETAHQKLLSGT
jgi:hypothetical protein